MISSENFVRLPPRDSAKFISKHSEHVKITADRIENVANLLIEAILDGSLKDSSWQANHSKWNDAHRTCNWCFFVNTVNFSFWSEPDAKFTVSKNGRTETGYYACCLLFDRAIETFRKASISADTLIAKAEADGSLKPRERESRVMVLFSGGTIGMKVVDGVFKIVPNYLPKALRHIPHLHDHEYASMYFSELEIKPYVLPPVKDEPRRILYWLFEYDPLLDSTNMTVDDWIKISKDIYSSYDEYDGFVILHGADTLCYTASALSFLFDNLGKPIILTGAQIPLTQVRSDGRKNFVEALIIAGYYDIPEVSVYFNNRLFRGNRTIKADNNSLDAYQSPNYPPLAHSGINININWDNIYRSPIPERVTIRTALSTEAGLLRIFPSISIECVKAFFSAHTKGVVLQTFGSGAIPDHRTDILDELKRAADAGVLIVNVTQCCKGIVDCNFTAAGALNDIGVISGSDMTTEAALTKLLYVLAFTDLTLSQKKELMRKNLRGELSTPVGRSMLLSDSDILRRMAKMFHLSSSEEISQLRDTLFPPLVCNAASQGDIPTLIQLQNQGAVIHHRNFEKRTALHVASACGQVDTVQYLLSEGVSVHAKDDNDVTPLMDAVHNCHFDIIKLLKKAGAHLKLNAVVLGAELCKCAANGDLQKLKAWILAGCDISTKNYDGRTALHVACTSGFYDIAEYLLENGANPSMVDVFGYTPLSNALKLNHPAIITLLKKYFEYKKSRASI